ncbi:MAG TPA: hypothetical protein VJ725_24830 [Thermoanaerobaculia bacterium]|nr:hypothetical protein [Thermoanaerobaculia bacterium]
MPPRRESPLPKLPISLEALPPPENVRRGHRLALSLAENEIAMIEKAARERGEQPAVFCRTVVLTAFQNSALRALGQKPGLLELSPAEQQQLLLEAFSFNDKPSRTERSRPRPAAGGSARPNVKRSHRLAMSFTQSELAMIERTAQERGEQPAVFCRTIILTAFENSASRARGQSPDLLELSPTEQQRALLEVFALK